MKLGWRSTVNIIVIVALGVASLGWATTRLAGGAGTPMDVVADFASAGGVFTDQEVTYRGVVVGSVGDLALNDNGGVDIHLLIDDDWSGRIPADAIAAVSAQSVVGEQAVNLTPRTSGGSTLSDGDVIPRDQTRLPVDIQSFLTSLDRALGGIPPDRTRRLIQNLAGGLGGRSEQIATILQSLGTLSRAFASVAPNQRTLLTNSTIAGKAFLSTKDEFVRAIRAADQVAAGIGDEPGELSHLFAANDRLARRGIALLARRSGSLARGIGTLGDFFSYQMSQRAAIEDFLTFVPQFLHAIEDASVPWLSPDGRFFYRIRVGLVVNNVKASWPCKYVLPHGYERLPHVRTARATVTTAMCRPVKGGSGAAAASLVAALKRWARAHRYLLNRPAQEHAGPGALAGDHATPTPAPTASPTASPSPSPGPTPSPTSTAAPAAWLDLIPSPPG